MGPSPSSSLTDKCRTTPVRSLHELPPGCPNATKGGRMAVDERRRLQLADAAKRALGDDAGITLMEMLPPVGWADVATKQDLAALELRLEARFERGFRQILVTVSSLVIGAFLVNTVATLTAILVR